MVDIEVRRARVYFSVGNKAKMGAGALGVVKCSLWGQNGVVLAFLGPKRRCFSHHKLFFFLFKELIKTESFWSVSNQNGVVLLK